MAEICVDANVVIDYARERAKRELGIKSASVNAAMLRKHLGRSLGEGRVVIPSTAYDEAQSSLDKDVTRMVDKADAERVLARATLVISAHLSNSVRIDNLALDEAREMYKAARSIPKSQKFAEWYSRKSRHVSRPSLGSGNDLVILSTAAQNAEGACGALDGRHRLYHVCRRDRRQVQRRGSRHLQAERAVCGIGTRRTGPTGCRPRRATRQTATGALV